MKPVHVGLLVAAAALGGAFFMKVLNRSEPAAPPAITASAPAPAPAEPAAEPPVAEPAKPAAVPEPEPVAVRKPAPKPKPVQTARAQTPAPATVESPAAAPQPPAPAPAAPVPPASPASSEPSLETKVLKPVEPPPPPPRQVTLTAGTLIPVRLVETLASDRMSAGDTFSATLDAPLVVDSLVIAERGAKLQGRVVNIEAAGRVRGVSALGIELVSLKSSDGQTVKIQTDTFQKQ